MMTRKQFEVIAKILGRADAEAYMVDEEIRELAGDFWEEPTPAQDVVMALVREFCEFLADENPRFDKETFLTAIDETRQTCLYPSGVLG